MQNSWYWKKLHKVSNNEQGSNSATQTIYVEITLPFLNKPVLPTLVITPDASKNNA